MTANTNSLTRIFEAETIADIRGIISSEPNVDSLRESLYLEFLKYTTYSCAVEWNRAVRLCECLAVTGWGDHEALEAVCGVYFNGNPETFFVNRHGEVRFLSCVWSKRKDGFVIDPTLSFIHSADGISDSPAPLSPDAVNSAETQNLKLASQRNWIAKNPICITRGLANCYENSKPLIDSMENRLKPMLSQHMRPELYGAALNRIILNCSFSFFDNDHCKTNYIIADPSLKLKQKDFYGVLLTMFSQEEIERQGYYLRNRFSYGPFRSDTGCTRIGIVFEKEFSQLPHSCQKEQLSTCLLQAVRHTASRLRSKLDYNFDAMTADFAEILDQWCRNAD